MPAAWTGGGSEVDEFEQQQQRYLYQRLHETGPLGMPSRCRKCFAGLRSGKGHIMIYTIAGKRVTNQLVNPPSLEVVQ